MKISDSTKVKKPIYVNFFPYSVAPKLNPLCQGDSPRQTLLAVPKNKKATPLSKIMRNNRRKFSKRKAKRLAEAEADEAEAAKEVRNESVNALDKTFKTLNAHQIKSKPTKESAILDSAASSSCCPTRAKLKPTGRKSTKAFAVPTGQVAEVDQHRLLDTEAFEYLQLNA